MPNLTIGTVQTEFTADNRKFDVATAGVEKQLEAVGRQAEAAAAKVKSAGDVIDRTAAQQERAKERARRAWQQEMLAQEQVIEKERELARARELVALRAEIEERNEERLTQARERAAVAAERMAKISEGLMRGLELAGIGFGLERAVEGFKEMVNSTMETGVELGHLSQQTGISVEDLSVLKFAARSTGIEFETLTKGFKKLSTEVYEADSGSRQAAKAFADLGISQAELKAKGNDLYGVLTMIADRFKDMPDGIQKNALATELFGRAGQQLIPVLNQGAEGIERLKAQAPIFSEKDVESMEKMHKATVSLSTAWDNLGKSITTAIGPALTASLNWLSEGIERDRRNLERTKELYKGWFDTLSRIRFGVKGGAPAGSDWMQRFTASGFYLAPPEPAAQVPGEAEAGKPKPGPMTVDAGIGGSGEIVAPEMDTPFSGTSKWTPVTDAIKAYFQQLRADQAAASASDAETARIAGERAWSTFQQGAQPDLSVFKSRLPSIAAPLPDMPDRWKDFRDNMIKTTDAFTDLQHQVTDLVDQALRSFNSTLVELATGRKANWSGFFRGLAGSSVTSGLQQIEGRVMGNAASMQAWRPAAQGANPMSTFLRTIGGLLGFIKPGGIGPGPSVPLDAMTTDYQIPFQSLGLLDLPGRALGGPVLAGHAYMVGEGGPEPFIPSTSGRIVPHDAMGGGGAFYDVHIPAGVTAAQVRQDMQRMFAAMHGSAVQSAVKVQQERRRRTPNRN